MASVREEFYNKVKKRLVIFGDVKRMSSFTLSTKLQVRLHVSVLPKNITQ